MRMGGSNSESSSSSLQELDEQLQEIYNGMEDGDRTSEPRRLGPGKASLKGLLSRVAAQGDELEGRTALELQRMRRMEASRSDPTLTKIGLVLDTLPERARAFIMSMRTRWPEVFAANPAWIAKIERDIKSAHLYPPRGAASNYLDSVLTDLGEMLDKEQQREENPSRSVLRSLARRKAGSQRVANPVIEYNGEDPYGVNGMTDFVHQGAQLSGGTAADPYDAPGPDAEDTCYNPQGTVTIGEGKPLHFPIFSYGRPTRADAGDFKAHAKVKAAMPALGGSTRAHYGKAGAGIRRS